MRDPTKLHVWKRGVELSAAVARSLPIRSSRNSPGLRRQAIRAASQVVEAISEGCGKRTNREFGRYLDIAIGSTTELQTQIVLSVRHGIMKRDIAAPLYREAEEIRRMLYAFKRWIDGKDDREKPAGS